VKESTKESAVLKDYPKFTAAAVQQAPVYHDKPVYFDMPATLDNAVKAIKEAASNGAELVVFPELAIPGYCHFALELTKGPEYTSIWAEYLRHGIEVPSDETDILCEAARRNKVNLVMGINERVAKYGGRQHNSALFIDRRGEVVGLHRKVNITVQELLIHTRGNGGQNLVVPEFDFGKVSALICGEHNQPMLWNNYIIQGTKVNCSMWPGYLGGAEELPWVTPAVTTAVASTGACWCVLAAEYIPPEKRPKDFYPNTSFYQSFGGSAIISPFGEIVAGPLRDQEGIVYGDIDLKVNEMARGIINITGLYSRWDILSLRVRQEDYEPIVPMEAMESSGAWLPPAATSESAPASAPPPLTPAQRAAEASTAEIAELRERIAYLERRLAETERPAG
jgi:nitrilase